MRPLLIYVAITIAAVSGVGHAMQGVADTLEARTTERAELIQSLR